MSGWRLVGGRLEVLRAPGFPTVHQGGLRPLGHWWAVFPILRLCPTPASTCGIRIPRGVPTASSWFWENVRGPSTNFEGAAPSSSQADPARRAGPGPPPPHPPA